MGDNGSIVGSSEVLSAVLVNQNGSRNKRKFLSDLSVDIPVDVATTSLTEFPRYGMLEEKFRNALNELGSLMVRSEDINEEQEVEHFQQADWDNPIACQLEELLTTNLFATFHSAVKQLVECGYTKEAAEWAVLNRGLYHGIKDAVSNVVDGALAFLRREKEPNMSNHPLFEGLQSLVDYTILEMIHVLREVRPSLTIAEAMWYLLISDLNLVNACVVEGGPSDDSFVQESPGASSVATISQSKDEVVDTGHLDSNNSNNLKHLMLGAQSLQLETPVTGPVHQLPNSKPPITREHTQTSPQSVTVDEKSGCNRKASSNSKRDMLRQKTFHFEKSYKGRMSKGAFKAKVAARGSMALDKSLKSQSGSSSVVMKGTYSKLTTSAGTSGSLVEGKHHPSSNLQSGIPAGVLPVKDPVFALPAVISKSSTSSLPDLNHPSSNGEIYASGSPKATDCYAAIPYDANLQKYVPQDDKDETILMLVPHKQVLEKELQGWTDWANEKVMQAARRLGKDQGELKMLRKEKEETEKFNKERQTLEENAMKRLSERENSLSNMSGQITMANSAIRRLEEENSVLKEEMEAAKLQALRSAASLQEAVQREQEALKKSQSWDAEKGLILEQLTNLKRLIAELENRLEKAKRRVDQFREEKEKVRAAMHINSLRGKKEEEDALKKGEGDRIKQMAELNMQKCKEEVKNLESVISELRLESDKSKIAALNVGYGSYLSGGENASTFPGVQLPKITKRLAVFQDNFGAGSVKPERECIMCMTEEISVVFLPCAHQVLCRQCSNLHEKQGMDDCPSCRTMIQERISVGYRDD